MDEQSPNPFAGLDKELLRSTRHPQSQPEPSPEPQPPVTPPRPVSGRQPFASTTPSSATRSQASDQASTLASSVQDMVETIRRAVKLAGKEVSFVRLTAREKGELADIVYTYKRQGRKTSENEINRIAINLLLEDYRAHGQQSVLVRVLAALDA